MAGKRSFGTIRKLKSGRYQVRYRRHDKQLSSGQTFGTKTDASAHLSALETDLSRGRTVEPRAGRVPLGDYARTQPSRRHPRACHGQIRISVRKPVLLFPHASTVTRGAPERASYC